jgi:hypothetical protein
VGSEHYAGLLTETLLGLNLFLTAWGTFFMMILTSDLQMKEQTVVRVIEGGLGVLLSLLFGLRYGLPGVIAGMVVSSMVTSLWFFPFIVCRKFHYSLKALFLNELSRIAVYVCIMFAIGFAVRQLTLEGLPVLISITIRVSMTLLIGAGIAWIVLMNGRLRQIVIQFFRSGWKKKQIYHEPTVS